MVFMKENGIIWACVHTQLASVAFFLIKADNSLLEEEILNFIEELDRLVEVSNELEGKIKEKEERFELFARKNQEEREDLERELERNRRERDELIRQVDKVALETYAKVLESKGGVAIVPVRDGICQGCFMSVTTNDIAKMMKGDSLFQCRTCQRIIFLE